MRDSDFFAGITHKTLLRFENEHGETIVVPKMTVDMVVPFAEAIRLPGVDASMESERNASVTVAGGFYLAEDLARLNPSSGIVTLPPVHDERMMRFLRTVWLKGVWIIRSEEYKKAKLNLTRVCVATLNSPNKKQKKFVANLKLAAETAGNALSEFLASDAETREHKQRLASDARFARLEAERACSNL